MATPDLSSLSSAAAPQPSAPDAQADTGRAARVGLWALGLGFGGFLLWAGLAPLDEGVPSQGMVAIDTKRKAVQHLSGGIVKAVLVREGDVVKEGQTQIQLDEAVARANHEAVRQRYLGFRAMQGRLLAEQTGAASIAWHPDLKAEASDPLIQSQITTQEQLFRSRRADRIKILVWDGSGLVLVWKQLEGGAFRWPAVVDGVLRLTPVEFAALFDGIDWRRVQTLREIPTPSAPA